MARVFYAGSLEIPPSTTWARPAELLFGIPAGIIVEWYIHGAPEHQHQVSIAGYHLEHRVFPEGEMEYFYPSEHPAVFRSESSMTPNITRVVVRGANTDDTYPHTVYIGITIETVAIAERLMERLWALIVPPRVEEE